MRQVRHVGIFGALAVASLLTQSCATQSGSGTGTERTQAERIGEQPIKEADPNRASSGSRTSPEMQSELSSRNTSGVSAGLLMDALFDFDRDNLRPDALIIVEANAKRLKELRPTQVLLEGRGDEVGTSAYNLVLGERRAKNVKRYLQQLGLSIDLKTTSYGKDRPLCLEHSPDCMQKNRSVHFVVKE
jgi:peptidoglycan-associated lipoprotein